MGSSARKTMGIGALLLGAVGGPAQGQTTFPNVKVSGRLQQQFYHFDNGAYASAVGPRSNVFTRRARIDVKGQISENVSVSIQPSFEGGRPLSATTTCTSSPVPPGGGSPTITCRTTGRSGLRLRDAYIDVRFTRAASNTALYLRAGQEKRPVSRYELASSTNLPSIERGAGQGLPGRASNNLFESAGFLSHDVGASVRLDHELDDNRRATLKLGVYNGQGESLNDVNDRKSFGVRGTFAVTSKLDVGASWFAHDGADTLTNYAFDLDAQYGSPGNEGLFVLTEYLQGNDASAAKLDIRGFQALAAYNIRMQDTTAWLRAVEPALRIDLADPDSDLVGDRVTTLTAVVGFYMSSRAWIRIAYERQSFQSAALESVGGIRSMLAVNF